MQRRSCLSPTGKQNILLLGQLKMSDAADTEGSFSTPAREINKNQNIPSNHTETAILAALNRLELKIDRIETRQLASSVIY
jgi:hypothetical protein